VPCYCSLTIHYDIFSLRKYCIAGQTVFDHVRTSLLERLRDLEHTAPALSRVVKIPVCYESHFAPDLAGLSGAIKISVEEIIHIHTSVVYRVYMLGFLPGFAYMGEIDEKIAMPRKSEPVPVAAGSVGIAGRQTGIYPLSSPGGWQIIGKTPVILFDAACENPCFLDPGDRVQFYSITSHEFKNY